MMHQATKSNTLFDPFFPSSTCNYHLLFSLFLTHAHIYVDLVQSSVSRDQCGHLDGLFLSPEKSLEVLLIALLVTFVAMAGKDCADLW